jgi:putative methyltransferase (TIGR04325 family)
MKNQPSFSVWEGVYESFTHAGGDMDAFDTDRWIQKQQLEVKKALETSKAGGQASQDYPLPIVVAMALATQKALTVLDFGGGMGIQYVELLAKVPEAPTRVKYIIVEGQSTVDNVPIELRQYPQLSFLTNFATIKDNVDIIHIGSTLHYIEDWKALLENLVQQFHPKYIVFSDLLVGDVSSFVSHQKYYDKSIPVWMINIQNFRNCMDKLKYQAIHQSHFQANILGHENLPNFALPEDKRIQKTLNVIFRCDIEHDNE